MPLKVLNNDHLWYAKGLQFQCTSCGNCCTGGPGYIWISSIERKRLADHLKISVDELLKQYCRTIGGRISLKEKHRNARGEYDCIFLKEVPAEPGEDGKVRHARRICSIYPVRPLQCRTWPFWEGLLASEEDWDNAARRCPGMNRGRRWSLQQIHAMRDAEDWPK